MLRQNEYQLIFCKKQDIMIISAKGNLFLTLPGGEVEKGSKHHHVFIPSYKKEFFVRFGYDYYMYLGAIKDCPSSREKVQNTGLFVEDYHSPYGRKGLYR